MHTPASWGARSWHLAHTERAEPISDLEDGFRTCTADVPINGEDGPTAQRPHLNTGKVDLRR